jgi:hypothetical protein
MAMNKQTFKLKTKRGLHRRTMVWPWVTSRRWHPSSTLPCLRKLSCTFSCLQHQDVMQVLMSDYKIPTDFIIYWWWVEVKFVIPQDQNIELHETENSFHSQSLVFKIWLVAIELKLRSPPFVLPLPHWIGAFLNKDWQGYIENNKKTQQEMTKETSMEN